WLDAKPWADAGSPLTRLGFHRQPGRARIVVDAPVADRLTVRETWDPGWTARLDGLPIPLEAKWGVFLWIQIPSGHHEIILEYDPREVRLGLAVSACAMGLVILVLTGKGRFWIPGIEWAGAWTEPSPRVRIG